MQRIGVVLFGVGIAALVGCAVGSEPEIGTSELMTTPIEAGADEDQQISLPPPSTAPDEDAGAPAKDAGGASDAGGGGDAGGGTPTACNATNTCAASTDLGSISGDQGSDSVTQQGSTSAWFKVRVTEDDNSVFGTKLKMYATLQSPAGANFDLFVYVPGSDTIECSTVSATSTSTGAFDSANVSFGEGGALSNGSADDRTVTVEVRHVSGACSPSAKWTLNLYGNQ
jgi:hypothetical protein